MALAEHTTFVVTCRRRSSPSCSRRSRGHSGPAGRRMPAARTGLPQRAYSPAFCWTVVLHRVRCRCRGTLTFPIGINDRGQIVGYYDDAGGMHGFLRQKTGGFSRIDPGCRATEALKINNRGQIVGIYVDFELEPVVFCSTAAVHQDRLPGCLDNGGPRLNDRGQVVGVYLDADGSPRFSVGQGPQRIHHHRCARRRRPPPPISTTVARSWGAWR